MLERSLYLCRHSQSEFNQQGRLQGQIDSRLSTLGIQQAKQLAEQIPELNLSLIAHSRLSRATETAQLSNAKAAIPIVAADGLQERHFGQWQGQNIRALTPLAKFKSLCYHDIHLRPPEGESTHEVRQRFNTKISELLTQQPTGNIMLISHGDAIACFASQWPHLLTQTQALQNTEYLRIQNIDKLLAQLTPHAA